MSYNIFFISDHHLGHESPYTIFKRNDGSILRKEFSCADEGDEAMVARHNSVVKDNDRVYFVGDVAMHKKHLPKIARMRGRKVLIKGNHDIFPLKEYLPYFDDVRAYHQFKGVLIAHIPVHPDSLGRWGFQIQGHLHANRVMTAFGAEVDKRYFNVSVECINYTPVSLEEIKKFKP